MDEIIHVIKKCDVSRRALNDNGYLYILPLNFGMQVKDEKIILYFHGAKRETKYELIAKDNRESFEMDYAHKFATDISKGSCTMEYESVIIYMEYIPMEVPIMVKLMWMDDLAVCCL